MASPDPRLLALLPVFERQARRFASKYSFALDLDDAVQLARVALWQCAERAPGLSVEELGAFAWPRALGSIVDVLRSANGGRRLAQRRGFYGYDVAAILGARAVGDLPEVAFAMSRGSTALLEELTIEPIDPHPLPDALLSIKRAQRRRTANLLARLSRLNERQLRIVALFLLGMPRFIVAASNGVSHARVSQVLAWFSGRTKPRRTARRRMQAVA